MDPYLEECYRLLPRVSRTFALNIRILPGPLRSSVTIAYLLFRYADTVEDCPGLEAQERSELFEAILKRVEGGLPLRFPRSARERMLRAIQPEEAELMLAGEHVFSAFENLRESTRRIIGSHVAETTRGMRRMSLESTSGGLFRLKSWQQLEEYCYYVAGSIGIMLTRLFGEHSRYIDRQTEKRLTVLGTSFGRGLQLTNILKGIGIDRREGRVYLPSELLEANGLGPENLLEERVRERLMAAVHHVIPRALQDLEDALRYTILLPRREPRLRLFCLWPLFTAVRTLAVVASERGVASPGAQAKIGRAVLYREMAASLTHVYSNGRLRKRFDKFRRELFPAIPRKEVWAG